MLAFLVVAGFANLGTIRKKEDPILKTQTDPITHKQKMEEVKDGEKGAPLPSFRLYEKPHFLSEPPVETPKVETVTQKDLIPETGEPIPEDLEGVEEEPLLEDWWFEEDEEAFKDEEEMDEF